MDLDAIAVFVKVIETGSFSGAARLLGMPKTTVSAKVAQLEKRLKVNLIQRTTRKLYVTEAGEKYFSHCVKAIREVELAEAVLHSSQGKPTGLLRVTAPVDLGHTLLPHITQAYLAQYPDTQVELIIANRVVDLIGEGIDLAIRAGSLKDSSFIAKRFFAMQSKLWASPAYLQTIDAIRIPEDLNKANFVSHTVTKIIPLTNGKTEHHITAQCRITADDLQTIKTLLMMGEGVGWLPDFLVKDAVAQGTLVPVLPEWKLKIGSAFYFVYARHKYTSPNIQAFMQIAQQLAASTL